MGRLEEVSMAELHEVLAAVDERTPAERVLAAVAYKQGDSKARLAERHDVSWRTVDSWLTRFVERPVERAPYDEQRPGRPPKLTEEQRAALFCDLREPPEAVGYDRQTWGPGLVQRHVEETFGVEYSLRHVRRLLDEAAVS
jgi:transposase